MSFIDQASALSPISPLIPPRTRLGALVLLSAVGLGIAGCGGPQTFGGSRVSEVADVKTCGCPTSAGCGDCCGKEHCRCGPTSR